jgi:hypothetical protein
VLQHFIHSSSHDYCQRCDREFVNEHAKSQHIVNSYRHYRCRKSECRNTSINGADYETRAELLQHYRDSSNHYRCFSCNLDHEDEWSLRRHWAENPSNHWICNICPDSFASRDQLHEHYDNDHFFCSKCSLAFSFIWELNEHFQDHWNHHWCARCKRDFVSEVALTQHEQSSPMHFLCKVCHNDYSCMNELVQVV